MRKYFYSILLIVIFTNIKGQYNVVIIDNDYGPNEPSVEINPYNTNEIVAGANAYSYYYSSDGGYTWTEGYLSSTYGVWGDPVIACDVNGDFYYFHLSNPDIGDWIDRIVCQKSIDGGVSWNNGTYTGLNGTKEQDKEWVSIDRQNNNIYVTWTEFDSYGSMQVGDSSRIMFSMSLDGGNTWTQAKRINKTGGDCVDDDNTVEGAVPVVGTGGALFVCWAGRSENGDLGIMFDKSYDYDNTWLNEDVFVTDFPGGWAYDIPGLSRCNGLPVIKCDTTGGIYNGRIYINWTDQQNGLNDTDVWLIYSDDDGVTWSEKIRVNNDNPGKHQFLSWMDIDQTNGKLYFIFYDRRNYSDNFTDVYLAISDNGGNTFENIKISETPFLPSSSIFFGDYTNISVHNGKIAPIWTRLDGSERSIRTIVPDNLGIKYINELTLPEVYPNPSNGEFYFSFKLKTKTNVSLFVVDIYGNTKAVLLDNETYKCGKYIETFSPALFNFDSGVYLFKFIKGDIIETKKIVYRK